MDKCKIWLNILSMIKENMYTEKMNDPYQHISTTVQ